MATSNSHIPILPNRPRVLRIGGEIQRSYKTGRQNYSRATLGQELTITVSIEWKAPFISTFRANLVTTMNSLNGERWTTVPFLSSDSRTWECRVKALKPGLHSFRAEFSTDNGKTWIRDNAEDAWILIDPLQVDGLRLYTLIPNVSGTIADWTADLERIQSMGFNAVHLLPLTMLDASLSPYSAKDLFNIDPMYLDPDSPLTGLQQLESFVDEAKRLNIRLCFDLVLNHIGVNSNIVQQAPDWIVPDPTHSDGFQRARYLTDQGWFFWDDLVLINYEHPSECIRAEIWSYMTRYMLLWAKYADATGGFVRFDNLHSSNRAFIRSLAETLHNQYPQVAILAEYFADQATMIQTSMDWGLNLNLATPWDYKFVPKLREYLKYIHRVSDQLRFFMPITSHDSGTPAQEFCNAESTIPRYVAAALLGTGATGIVQGVEFGNKEKINFIGKRPKMKFPADAKFVSFIKRINSILVDFSEFHHGGTCTFVDNEHHAIIAAFRQQKGINGILVVCNFDILSHQHISIDSAHFLGIKHPLSAIELISGDKLIFESSKLEFNLRPCSALVLHFPSLTEMRRDGSLDSAINQYY